MTRNDIIRMALESGFGCDTDGHIFTYNQDGICDEYLERFADLVAAVEQDRCCKIIYSMAGSDNVAQRTVDAIRGQK